MGGENTDSTLSSPRFPARYSRAALPPFPGLFVTGRGTETRSETLRHWDTARIVRSYPLPGPAGAIISTASLG